MQTTGSLPDEDSFHVSRVVATCGVGKKEIQRSLLRTYMMIRILSVKSYTCDECGKGFLTD